MMKEDERFILSLDKIPSFEELLLQMKIAPVGFGSIVLGYIYKNIFSSSLDLKEQYFKYYSVEYHTFEEFIFKKVGIKASSSELARKHVLLIDWFMSLLDPSYEGNFLNTVINQLEVYREN